jgi:glycosyltransferase involved in cell wall biosynthesis
MMTGSTVVVVTNTPRPYRTALFRTLKPRLAADGLELRVIYTSDPSKHVRRGATQPGTFDPAAETFLEGTSFRLGYERVLTIPTDLGKTLKGLDPACVVVGGFGVNALMAEWRCKRSKLPFVIWSGAWPGGERHIGGLELRSRRRLVKRADAYVTYGSAAADYLVQIGAERERVFSAWNTVDLEGIAESARLAGAHRAELADKYGLAAKNLLFVGSLVERKGLRELVSAALAIDGVDADWALHLVGGGPLTEELRATVDEAAKQANFRFQGLRPESDVAELLGLVDGFLLPTKQEAWGLVYNEAMACGLPVVASPHAGATRDLVEDSVSGYVVEPTDLPALTEVMRRMLSDDPSPRLVAQRGAIAVREKASLDRAAAGFAAAVACAIGERRGGRH